MAVTNFHYITRMSSGFKVYILEGQPNLRSEDRFRHMTSDRVRMRPAHPMKRKHSSDRGRTLEERRERALSKCVANSARRSSGFSIPESPTSTWSPTASPTHLIPSPVFSSPVMDEPLALIKKPRPEPEKTESQNKATTQIQMRPSVITCVSSASRSTKQDCCNHSTAVSKHSYDHVEEHFQRSLGINYHRATSISVSVDDHFAKALGDKWLQLKASSSSCHSSSSSSSSSPPSSPTFIHSPGYSPKRARKDSSSPTTTTPNFWSDK
ncbi:vestigial like 4 like [Danio rerio]|uniref:Vestigial-like 4 like n=1 Tax=Danio rerio TaxID=7955 RepID=Q1RLU0_DANRE|nr:vestigial like 4 like [Danio rerio]AAI15291.2 Vestigial like 4 like [Danio rerio]AAI29254.1 Vestigial like 4 like [Danio rerio]|eukprot:NP_001073467.1 vestigial like 4 like [Danio rerio]